MIAKVDGLEPQTCESIKGIVAPEIGTKSFRTFEKQAPDLKTEWMREVFKKTSW